MFDTKALPVFYISSEAVKVVDRNEYQIFLYFVRDLDKVDCPLSISEEQANQLYKDLKSILEIQPEKSK